MVSHHRAAGDDVLAVLHPDLQDMVAAEQVGQDHVLILGEPPTASSRTVRRAFDPYWKR